MTNLSQIPRASSPLFDATADLSPEEARALEASAMAADHDRIERINSMLERGTVRPDVIDETRPFAWAMLVAAIVVLVLIGLSIARVAAADVIEQRDLHRAMGDAFPAYRSAP